MNTLTRTVAVILILMLSAKAEEIKRRGDSPKPLTPEQSLKEFRLPDGLQIELVAAEPLIADPSAMAFDSQGRLFVSEIHGYNVDGHIDITELNKTGVLDKEVRRILVDDETLGKAEEQTFGVVKLLEDTKGDGRMDRVIVWDDKLPACFGVVPTRDGVIALCAPDIIYLGDTDHDGQPDVREVLFTGFGVGELWTRINSPRRGIDNWIYVGTGIGAEGTITGPHLRNPVKLGFTSFRFKADGSAIEPVTGAAHGYGQTLNAWGDRFVLTNQEHAVMAAPLPYRQLMRNPHIATPDPVLNISSDGHPAKLYPISKAHPWRTERARQPQWVKFYGANETTSGLVTSACGPLVYLANGLTEPYQGDHFSCDPSQNLVHHCELTREGLRYSASRPPDEQTVEFLASTETWFRPVSLSLGPGGALYIVDMYREIIEDYSAIPRYLQQQYGLIEGHQRGRIWRVVRKENDSREILSPSHPPTNFRRLSTKQLVGELGRKNLWTRQTAQQILVERQDKTANLRLVELATHGIPFYSRLHALQTLDGLGGLTAETIAVALKDDHFAVRVHALQFAERWLDKDSSLKRIAISMCDDPEPRVRLQLSMTLGQFRDPDVIPSLSRIAKRDGDDAWMRAAILSSVPDSSGHLLTQLVFDPGDNGVHLVEPLASIVGARGDLDEVASVVTMTRRIANQETLLVAILKGLSAGLENQRFSGELPDEATRSLAELLAGGSGSVRAQAFRVARAVNMTATPVMKSILSDAARDAADEQVESTKRKSALVLLGNAPFPLLSQAVATVLAPGQPSDIQVSAVKAIASSQDDRVPAVLLENWNSHTPTVRSAVIEAIFSRTSRLGALLDAVEQGHLTAQQIDAFHRVQLLESSDTVIQNRASTLLADTDTAASDEVLAIYQKALDNPRDPKRGEAVFRMICANCHRLNNVGQVVGPDLAAAKGRADETLLLDILRPSRQITVGYQSYQIMTDDGRIANGILTAETATSITLRLSEGVERNILRADIEQMRSSEVSLMPEGMEKQITPQDTANLIAFLRITLGAVVPRSVTLFDEETNFAESLHQGAGTARIVRDDPHRGEISLLVTPPQRFSPRIDGWQFRIRENPEPGEYRYLRFAWKTVQGTGIMLELADEGKWPARHEKRRYVSGNNTTRWGAITLSPNPPRQWTVVTRDLWKDFGDFSLTGIAPTAMESEAKFDRIELLRSLEVVVPGP